MTCISTLTQILALISVKQMSNNIVDWVTLINSIIKIEIFCFIKKNLSSIRSLIPYAKV